MSRLYIVVESLKDWTPYYPSEDVITFEDYLALPSGKGGRVRVINLCRQYKYLSKGYYCSLLAEARGHRVIPSVRTLNELERRSLFALAFDSADPAVAQSLKKLGKSEHNEVTFLSFFGTAGSPELDTIASLVFERSACPVTEIRLEYKGAWKLTSVRPVSAKSLIEEQQTVFANAMDSFSQKLWRKPRERKQYRYDMAILVNPEEEFPPSDNIALKKMIKVGKQMGIAVDLINPGDLQRVPEYDMLFIRETTNIDHHTFRFAKKAEAEGLIVMDDSTSIMRCTNKVYLADLLNTHQVPTPKTLILTKGDDSQLQNAAEVLGFPVVLKIPDGSFSRGVVKVENTEELALRAKELFRQSALLLAQEFMFTEFDWRIGVLNGKPIYACKYYMARNHWQIYHHGETATASGEWDTLPTYEVPKPVLNAAVKAANLIGKGLYGVDVKQAGNRAAVIEVNDNPSLESDVEDRYLGDELYRIIFEEFIRRIETKRKSAA